MQLIVQEGEASIGLVTPVQVPGDDLRTATIQHFVGPVKVYYRDFEVVRVEAREGALEILPAAVGAISWTKKERCYQLKPGG